MKLYNTLTRALAEIEPLNPPKVTVYTCGPTVYDYAHIGHWFNYVRMDTLVRTLKTAGFKVEWVMNITDVGHLVSDADEGEDKLEKGARRESKSAWDIAKFYEADFLEGMKTLNMLNPDHLVRATEHIPEQIELIKKLEDRGYTYITSDGVYYDTSKFEGYAAFARLDLDDQQEGARVAVNPEKRNPTDFALWKFSPTDKQRDMEWDSPWGKGFPGWHIECSAMAMKYLGESIDIHTGGIDHIPVHHTNEIAQSEAATGKRFAQLWMHSNHVMVDGQKISKSLGNGIRLPEIFSRGFTPDEARLIVHRSHYQTQSQFSIDLLDSAQKELKNIRNDITWLYDASTSTGKELDFFKPYQAKIDSALQDNLNTPEALAVLHEAADAYAISQGMVDKKAVDDFIGFIQERLGITIIYRRRDATTEELALLQRRAEARANKDWALADQLRDQLASQGIAVRDEQNGEQRWHKI